jgi:tetratricopeptide (TPR) repeat protein
MSLVLSSCPKKEKGLMYKTFATLVLGSMLAAAQTPAQTQPTAAELLQKGIYAQETAGDLDGAVKIYRQIVDSHPVQQEIAAQAQYRLGLTLLQKGDAALASQEIQRLAWDFPNYKELIASSKTANATPRTITFTVTGPTGSERRQMAGLLEADLKLAEAEDLAKAMALESAHDAAYDFSKTVTVTGTVAQVEFVPPAAWITVHPSDGTQPIRVSVESVSARVRAGGLSNSLKPGDQVVVTGAPARDGSSIVQATRISDNGAQVYLRGNTPTK